MTSTQTKTPKELLLARYVRAIGGKKNLRPGEEKVIAEIINAALLAGGIAERTHTLELVKSAESYCFFEDGKKSLRHLRDDITRLSVQAIVQNAGR